ncbi:hypothetical protein F4861DRAFT_207912 [Xylaria intraflava]|nr:hypothetical protein F4861DRAFT_207912 [Xylaria intraflava]
MRGVTAKARGVPQINPYFAKNIRSQQYTAPLSLRVPSQVSMGPCPGRDTTFSPRTDQMSSSLPMAPIRFVPGSEKLRRLERASPDTRTAAEAQQINAEHDERWPSVPKILSRASCCLPDLSSHHQESDSMISRLDNGALTRSSSFDSDPYGWETTFDRQMDRRNANPLYGLS